MYAYRKRYTRRCVLTCELNMDMISAIGLPCVNYIQHVGISYCCFALSFGVIVFAARCVFTDLLCVYMSVCGEERKCVRMSQSIKGVVRAHAAHIIALLCSWLFFFRFF